jgi:hypothetical protein
MVEEGLAATRGIEQGVVGQGHVLELPGLVDRLGQPGNDTIVPPEPCRIDGWLGLEGVPENVREDLVGTGHLLFPHQPGLLKGVANVFKGPPGLLHRSRRTSYRDRRN